MNNVAGSASGSMCQRRMSWNSSPSLQSPSALPDALSQLVHEPLITRYFINGNKPYSREKKIQQKTPGAARENRTANRGWVQIAEQDQLVRTDASATPADSGFQSFGTTRMSRGGLYGRVPIVMTSDEPRAPDPPKNQCDKKAPKERTAYVDFRAGGKFMKVRYRRQPSRLEAETTACRQREQGYVLLQV
ncbi:unnamed protein product [Nesidiocoris tenuis]|uniref:Uncharacterized protein n=1 Tax=Nesidiocoris tenuis TaxID=355587 RepID=A0A6H5HE39_9HEMI|nr:unnamed protein product [Nesidiocoris tenuis]CAB0014610.1 unnamed protein product [Nesidiocoris tenuis]